MSSHTARRVLHDLEKESLEQDVGAIRVTFMADLNLAISDPHSATMEHFAERFEDSLLLTSRLARRCGGSVPPRGLLCVMASKGLSRNNKVNCVQVNNVQSFMTAVAETSSISYIRRTLITRFMLMD